MIRTVLVAALMLAVPLTVSAPIHAQSPVPVSSSWRRIAAADFVVVGNASAGDLRRTYEKVAAFRHAFATMFPAARLTSGVPTAIVVFKDPDAFSRYQPRDGNGKKQNMAGYADFTPDGNVLVFGQRDDDYPVLFHEYAHYLVHRSTGFAIPTWVSEGLAEFYSTFEVAYDKEHDMVGRPLGYRLRSLASGSFIPLREIVSPRNMEEMWKSLDRISLFYAEAWALVHYLSVERRSPTATPLGDYLRALAGNASPDDAFVRAFGVDVDTMDRELRVYIRRRSFGGFKVRRTADVTAAARIEPMAEPDVHELQGRLLAYRGILDDADREFQTALRLDPKHVDARISSASVRVLQDRAPEAVDIIRGAIEDASSNDRAWYHLGLALLEFDAAAAIDAFTRGSKINERHHGIWLGLAEAALAEGRDGQARAALAQATTLEGNPGLYRAYAESALRFGRNDVAAAAARTFVDRAGIVEPTGRYGAFLAAIACRRLGQPAEADAILNLVAPLIAENTWESWVLRFMQKRVDGGAFLGRAKSLGEKTEAHTYLGFALTLDNRVDEAIGHFQWVLDHGERSYDEFGMARNEMARLRRQAAVKNETKVAW